jgi:hypothetical protein
LQFLHVDQIETALDGVEDGDDLAPDIVRAQGTGLQVVVRNVDLDPVALGPPLVDALAGPHGVGLVGQRAGRREQRAGELLVGRDGRSDLEQFFEPVDPEAFVDDDIAGIALRGAVVGAQKIEGHGLDRGAVFIRAALDDHRVTLQFDAADLLHPLDNVVAKDVRLRARGGNENLVLAGLKRDEQALAREIPRRADLARLEDHPGAQGRGSQPDRLMAEQPGFQIGPQLRGHLGRDQVLCLVLLLVGGPGPLRPVRVEIGLVAALAQIFALAGHPLELAAQKVDFLVVAAGLLFLGDQHQIPFKRALLGPLDGAGLIPLVADLPAGNGRIGKAEFVRDLADRPPRQYSERA